MALQKQKTKNYLLKYLSTALPIMASYLGVTLISLGDTVMINWLGKEACSEASIANWVFAIPSLFIIGFSSILAPLVATAVAQRNYVKATDRLKYILCINMVWTLLSCAGLFLLANKLSSYSLTGARDAYSPAAIRYLRILVLSLVPYSFLITVKRYMQSIGGGWNTHVMVLDLSAGVCNVVLNYLLIYGKCGFPALGMVGAGWATLLTRLIFSVINSFYCLHLAKEGYIQLKRPFTFSYYQFKKLLKLGLPSGLDLAIRIAYIALGNYMIKNWYGVGSHAATAVLFEISRIALMIPLGIAIAASILVGQAWGRKDRVGIQKISKIGYQLGAALILLANTVTYFTTTYFAQLLSSNSEVRVQVVEMVWVLFLLNLFDGFNVIGGGMLRGIRDTFVPFIFSAITYGGIGLPVCYLFATKLDWGAIGVWCGLSLGFAFSALSLYYRFFYKVKTFYRQ